MKLEEVRKKITLWETAQLALYTKTNDDGGGSGGCGDGDDEFKD